VIELYNELYSAWRTEKASRLPAPLPNDFYKRAISYLIGLREDSVSGDTHTIQGRLLMREREIADRLLTELRQTRLRKILENAKNGILVSEENLTAEEKILLRNLNDSLATLNADQIQREDPRTAMARTELAVVRFLQNIPEIVGTDLKIYGPYKKEDVGSLPIDNAQALIKQGAAKPIEVKGLA